MDSPQEAINTLLQEGIALARTGKKAAARERVRQATRLVPTNAVVWLCRAGLAEDRDEACRALEQVETLDPNHPQLDRARTWVDQTWPESSSPAEKRELINKISFPRVKLVAGAVSVAMVIGLALLILALNLSEVSATNLLNSIVATPTPTTAQRLAYLQQAVNQAKAAGNQIAIVESLTKMHVLAPDDLQIAVQLAQLHYEHGLAWRDANRLAQAQQSFEAALNARPDFAAAEQELRLVEQYLAGVEYYQQANWVEAAAAFQQVYQQDPTFMFVDEILYSAYYNLGVVQEADRQLSSALESYQNAIEILPDVPEARLKAKEITLKLNPPTPEPTPELMVEKSIVVDISDQRTYVYEDDELIYEFVVSTGEPGRDTAIGEFEIQSKIPMAYASTWNLDMPYWLGIYWSGPLENGFHAVPTVRDTGETMWDGYLGQRVSYGCIILSMADAETLYDWADMGTPVSIVP